MVDRFTTKEFFCLKGSVLWLFFIAEIIAVLIALLINYQIIIALCSVAFVIVIFMYTIQSPRILLVVLIFSILLGSLGELKVGGRAPNILIVDIISIPFYTVFGLKLLFGWPQKTKFPPGIGYFLLFLVIGAIVSLTGYNFIRSLTVFRVYLLGLICYIYTYNCIENDSDFFAFLRIIVFWGVCLVIYEFVVLWQLGGVKSGFLAIMFRKNLMTTGWGSSNYLSTFFVIILPLILGILFDKKGNSKPMLYLFALLMILSGVIITLSRGGMLAAGLAALVFLVFTVRLRNLISVFVVVVIVGVVIVFNPLSTVLLGNISAFNKTASYFSRLNVYTDVFNLIFSNPFWGVGWGNLGYNLKFQSANLISAHNIVLGLIAEVGLFALLAFLSLYTVLLKNTVSFNKQVHEGGLRFYSTSFLSLLIGVFIHSLMEPNFEGVQFAVIFWSVSGAFMKLIHISNSKQ